MAPSDPSRQHLAREKLLLLPSSSSSSSSASSSLSRLPSKLIRSFSSKLRSSCHRPHHCIDDRDSPSPVSPSASLPIADARPGFSAPAVSHHAFQVSGCFGKILQRQISARKGDGRVELLLSLEANEETGDLSLSAEADRRERARMHDISDLAEGAEASRDVSSPTCRQCGSVMSEVACKCHNHGLFLKGVPFRRDRGEFVDEISSYGCHNCGIGVKEETFGCNGGQSMDAIALPGCHKCGSLVKTNGEEISLCKECKIVVSKMTSGCQRCGVLVKDVVSVCGRSCLVPDKEMYGCQKSGCLAKVMLSTCQKCGCIAKEMLSTCQKCGYFAKEMLSACQESGFSVNRVPWSCRRCIVSVNNVTSSSHPIRRRNVELSWSAEQRACLLKEFGEGVTNAEEDKATREGLLKMKGSRRQCGCFINNVMNHQSKNEPQCEEEEEERTCRGLQTQRLPDDVIEMCLARASFSTLARARLVCRKWKDITMSSHLRAMREKIQSKKPWLFLFGFSRGGASSGEIHALDTSMNEWHSTRADILDGRSLFSVVSLDNSVYIIGGCSNSLHAEDKHEKGSIKTHREVLAYSPFTSSWARRCSMVIARAMPVASVFEVRDGEVVKSSLQLESLQWEDIVEKLEGHSKGANHLSSNYGSDWCRINKNDSAALSTKMTNLNRSRGKSCARDGLEMDHIKSYGLIVVGGQGIWKQPLFSAEIYDPRLDTWREIAKLPIDHGVTCAGVVCNGFFYAYSETDKLAAYDFKHNVWSSIQVSNSITRLHEYVPKLVCCKGKLILLAVAWGSRDRRNTIFQRNDVEAATRMLWEYNSALQSWILMFKHPDAPLDWNAVSVSEGNRIYGIEMFKIFGQVLDFVTVCDFSSKGGCTWKRMPRMRLGNDLDVASCFTKTAVVIQL